MTWHQQRAAHRAFQLRNTPAHILRADFIATGRTLCGVTDPAVWIDADKRTNPDNRCCKRCAAIADKQDAAKLLHFAKVQSLLRSVL